LENLNILAWIVVHPILAGCASWIVVGIVINAYRLWQEDDLLITFFAYPLSTLWHLTGTILGWPILLFWKKQVDSHLPYADL